MFDAVKSWGVLVYGYNEIANCRYDMAVGMNKMHVLDALGFVEGALNPAGNLMRTSLQNQVRQAHHNTSLSYRSISLASINSWSASKPASPMSATCMADPMLVTDVWR